MLLQLSCFAMTRKHRLLVLSAGIALRSLLMGAPKRLPSHALVPLLCRFLRDCIGARKKCKLEPSLAPHECLRSRLRSLSGKLVTICNQFQRLMLLLHEQCIQCRSVRLFQPS